MKLLLNKDLSPEEAPLNPDVRQNIFQLFAANDDFQPKEADTELGQEPSAQGNEPLICGEVAA